MTARITRRNHGTGHSYYLNGKRAPGVTAIRDMVAKKGLINWAGNATADYALDHWGELAELPPSKRLARLKDARNLDRDTAAVKGTRVHAIAQQIHTEGPDAVPVPEELRGYVESYEDYLDRLQPKVVATELVIARTRLIIGRRNMPYCGTLDSIHALPAVDCQGIEIPPATWLLDLKTSRSRVYWESALQLTGYREADTYVHPAGGLRDMAELGIERTGVLWIRPDGWDLYPVYTGPEVWAYFKRLRADLECQDDAAQWIGAAITPPDRPAGPPW